MTVGYIYTDLTVREKFNRLKIDFAQCTDLFVREVGWLDPSYDYSFSCSIDYVKQWAKDQYDIEFNEPHEIEPEHRLHSIKIAGESGQELWKPHEASSGFYAEIEDRVKGGFTILLYDAVRQRMYCRIF